MKRPTVFFNIYLALLLTLGLGAGCTSREKNEQDPKKQVSLIFIFTSANPDPLNTTMQVPIYREHPVMVTVNRIPVLNQTHVLRAKMIEEMGTYAIELQFNKNGTLILESMSVAQKGHRIAIYAEFGQARWLAAPKMLGRIGNGVLRFTPDASREEVERIVRGINNGAKKLQEKSELNPEKDPRDIPDPTQPKL